MDDTGNKINLSARSNEILAHYSAQENRPPEEVLEAALKCYCQAAFMPQLHLREAHVNPARTALLFIDVQNFNCHPDGALYAGNAKDKQYDYWWQRIKDAKAVWANLLEACRAAGIEVMYTVMQSLTENGRDRSLDYKISGFHIPKGSWDGEVLDFIEPQEDDIVVSKTSSSVFTTTNIDILLRNLDKKQLLIAGCLTDQCVESAIRDACDLNYICTMVTDGCCTYSAERQANSLKAIKGYCRQRTAHEVIVELSSS